MRVLLTGYEPLFGDTINPSIEAVKEVARLSFKGFEFKVVEISLDFKLIAKVAIEAIKQFKPDVIICTGVASKRPAISLERIAVNIVSGTDHNGLTYIEERIDNNAPEAYFCELPLLKIKNNILKAGIPAHISDTAGTHGCNYIFYCVSNYIAKNNLGAKTAFIHVPRLPEQVARMDKPELYASMTLNLQIKALKIFIESLQ